MVATDDTFQLSRNTVWKRFRKHRVAVFGAIVLAIIGAFAAFGHFVYPVDPNAIDQVNWTGYPLAPGVAGHVLGTDENGRDLLARLIAGAQISLTVAIATVVMQVVIGSVLGAIAGYYGGWVDMIVQRLTEIIKSFPHLPLWLALSAALPVTWSPLVIYFGITLILALLDWPGLGRAVRSKLLSLREEDYASAAQMMGAKPGRIIGRHLLPGFMSHLIASATLSIPSMILAETALSFLGLGLRPPITSWGVLLNEATDINVVAVNWWLMLPVVPVILVILAYQFMGDGMRDAADPYA